MTPSKARSDFDGTIWEVDEKQEEIEGLTAAGRPDPAYAAALGLIRAPFGRRAVALICDVVFWILVQMPLWMGAVPLLLKLASGTISPYGFINHPGFVIAVVAAAVTVFLTLVLSVLQLVMHGRSGRTLGKGIVGIRTVNVRTLERPGIGWVLLRYLLFCASSIVPLLGPVLLLISPTFDAERRGRGLHDKATHVWLIDVRQGLDPYDEKRLRVARKLVKAEPAPERSALPSLATPRDPSAQPQYRPGERISAGVIGVARSYEAHERPTVGLAQPAPAATPTGPSEAGKPVFGGYRNANSHRAEPSAPSPGLMGTPPPSMPPAAPQQQAPVAQPAPAPQAAPIAQPEPAPPAPAVRFELRFDTGESILISEPVLLGRNPEAAAFAGARPIALTDDSRSLSKTHLFVRPIDGGLEIIDCRSTNGSGLIRAGVEYAATADVPVVAIVGDIIRLGDRMAAVAQA